MIRSVEIKGLRGIRKGKLTDLTPLVVLVGPNGSGKSTVLDALFIAANPKPAEAVGEAVARREGLKQGARWLWWRGGNQGPAEIAITTNSAVTRVCTLRLMLHPDPDSALADGSIKDQVETASFQDRGNFSVQFKSAEHSSFQTSNLQVPMTDVPEMRFIDPRTSSLRTPLYKLFTRITEQGLHKQTRELLADLVPALEDIRILTEGDSPLVYLIFSDHAVPVALAGDGIRLLVELGFELATRPGGVVLLEEPEIHMHPAAIRQCARVILAAVQRDIQVVLTTHSLELIDSLLSECSDNDLNQLSVYGLLLQAGCLKSSRLAGPEVAFARTTIEDDLR